MYKISVPLFLDTLNKYDESYYLKQLKKVNCERVFLCPNGDEIFDETNDTLIKTMKKYVDFFHNNGLEVGCWVWTFQSSKKSKYTHFRNCMGEIEKLEVCPTDKKLIKDMQTFIKRIAATGIDLFMFDDDYRFGFQSIGFGCCCENHMKMISKYLKEDVSLETMKEKLLYGDKNKYRDAFLKFNGESLENYAQKMREALDQINPQCRMGFCACISSWDIDGTTPDKISQILAGKTKPFYRLIGAPYWSPDKYWGCRLSDVIEMERMESSRRKDTNIEIFAEGDTYPRPRYKCPASYLECFDTAIRASGCTDGILKYCLDYNSAPDYECGYVNLAYKNKALYRQIDNIFDKKQSCGLRVWIKEKKYSETNIPKHIEGTMKIQDSEFSPTYKLPAYNTIPSTYEGNEYGGVAFGEDIKCVPENELKSGLIIDSWAAEILQSRGIDVGIKNFGEYSTTSIETYVDDNNNVSVPPFKFRKLTLNNKCNIESYFNENKKKYPGSYTYVNKSGMKFLVLCLDAYFNIDDGYLREYTRQKQIIKAVEWFNGKKLPAVCVGNPDLYIQVKKGNDSTAVGLWNFSADMVEKPKIELDFKPKTIKAVNCNAKISGNKIILSDIIPFSYAFFEAK